MGLFRKLLGREPEWTERWSVYPSEIGDRLTMYNIDLGAVDAAPVAKLPLRLDVELTYGGDGASGMPRDDELVEIRTLEDAVDKAMRALGGAYVGRMLTDNTCRMTGYLPESAKTPELEALPARPSLRPRLTLTPDPAWTLVRDELAPDPWQRNVIDDLQVIQQLLAHDDQLDVPREVEFIAYFGEAERAEAAGEELSGDGFATTVEPDDEGGFALKAVRRDPVEAPDIHAITWLVRETVERHDGEYDGWGCIIQA
jgi:hypothetical protein